LNQDTKNHEPNEQNGRSGRRKDDRALNQMGADKSGDNDQRPIKQNEQENRPDHSANQKNEGGVLRILNKKCGGDCSGELAAGEETENSNRNLLKEQRKQSSN